MERQNEINEIELTLKKFIIFSWENEKDQEIKINSLTATKKNSNQSEII